MKSQNDGSLGRKQKRNYSKQKREGSLAFKIRAVLRKIENHVKNAKSYGVNFSNIA